MKRISFPQPETMSLAQKEVYDAIISGPRGVLIGPLRAALHNPNLADRWQKLGQVLRFETTLPAYLNELAILMAARRWNSSLEWAIHARDGEKAGLSKEWIGSIKVGELPDFSMDPDAKDVYEFSRQLLIQGDVEQSIYTAVMTRWGEVGVVELSSVIGYYSMVAMTLNVHNVPIPEEMQDQILANNGKLFVSPSI
ncbi:carboxymuconolactone decarboxylase family protein [Acinetobacter schindleri]|uniref:carboxymuconolactone decarboxylase family protein n=1 Tax=Acinetobacter schindleri TaxID=108981 RepID=UPI003D081097